jgi:hypothetical protein
VPAINPGGQAFAAAGGSGTIHITVPDGVSWTAASSLNWVSITGGASGAGTGDVTYRVVANPGAARSGTITVAGQSFAVEQVAASTAGLTFAGSMAHLVSGGTWKTTITLVNTGATPAQARLNFFDNSGNALPLPFDVRASEFNPGPLLASTLDRTLNAGATLVLETASLDGQAAQEGSAQLFANGTISGLLIFHWAMNQQEAVVPVESRNAAAYLLPFDNTGGLATGVALANLSAQPADIAVTIRDESGAVVPGSKSIGLAALGHTSFMLTDREAVGQRRGTIEFDTPPNGRISVIGLRFTPAGAFTTIPVLAK